MILFFRALTEKELKIVSSQRNHMYSLTPTHQTKIRYQNDQGQNEIMKFRFPYWNIHK